MPSDDSASRTSDVDYIVLCSGTPMPRKIEKCEFLKRSGRSVLVGYVRRNADVSTDAAGGDLEMLELGRTSLRSRATRSFLLLKYYFRLRKVVRLRTDLEYDVLADSIDLLLVSLLLPGKRRAIRFEVRDLNAYQTHPGVAGASYRWFERLLLRFVDVVVVTSPGYLEYYDEGMFRGSRVVVENYPAPESFSGSTVRPERRENAFVVGYVGFIRYMGPIAVLFEAMERVRAEGAPVECVFYGARNEDALRALAADRDWIVMRGAFSSSDLSTIYSDIDLSFCVYDCSIPNVRLAMPNKFYECLISKTPILVSRDTYLAERVKHVGMGQAVDGTSVEDMAGALREALKDGGWYSDAKRALEDLDISFEESLRCDLSKALLSGSPRSSA